MVPDVMKCLQACGEGAVLAKIVYQKPGEEWVTERLVEPYSISHTACGGIIVHTWQVNPELDDPSWRNFRVDRVVKASATAETFTPRIKVTIFTGESKPFYFGAEPDRVGVSPPAPSQIYTDRLRSALADLNLSDKDKIILGRLSQEITNDQKRAIHGRFYAETLNEICADGRVTNDEADRLTALRVWLNELGWSP